MEVRELRADRERTFVNAGGSLVRTVGEDPAPSGLAEISWGGALNSLAGMRWADASVSLLADRRGQPAPLGAPVWDGVLARYSTATEGTRLELQPAGSGVQGRIVIAKRPRTPVRLTFRLRLKGLQPGVGAGGAPQLVDDSGRVAAKVTVGRVAGAENDQLTRLPLKSAAASARIEPIPGGDAVLQIVPDAKFLSDPSVEYPVTVETGLSATPRQSSKSAVSSPFGAVATRSYDPSMCDGGVGGGTGGDCLEAPAGVTATAFNEKLDLTWSAPSGAAQVDGYTAVVRRGSDHAVVATQNVAASFAPQAAFTFRDGLVNGQNYYATVNAYNSEGPGPEAWSTTVMPAAAPWSLFDLMGTSNPSQPDVSCRSSWGVTCANGNFSWSRTYLRIPGRGVPLGLELTFNSHAEFRWTHNYLMRIVVVSASTRVVVQENGSRVYFFDDGAGGWHAAGGTQATLTRDASGNYIFKRLHDLTTYGFDSRVINFDHRLLWQSDRNGYRTTLSYDPARPTKPSRATDPAGRSLDFGYDGSGRLSTVSDSNTRRVTLDYGTSFPEVPSSITDPAGGVTSFGYEGDYLLNMIRSPKANAQGGSGQVSTVAYDPDGLASQSDPATERRMTYAYTNPEPAPGTASTNTTTVTDPRGSVAVARHTNYQVTSMTRGNGADLATSSAEPDPRTMRAATITDPRGAVSRQTFDSHANLLTWTDPLNRTTTYTYNAQERPETTTDPLGVTDTYTYDANSNLLSASRPLVGTSSTRRTTYGYDPSSPGDLTSVTDPNGKVWQYGYNANGDQTSSSDPLGNKVTSTYDPAGRRQTATSARGNVAGAVASHYTTTYEWNALDDLRSVTDPLGHRTTYDYDPNRNVIARTDANLNKTAYVYNVFDELTSIQRPDGSSVKTSYDKNGDVASQTDGAGHTTTYAYDTLNRLTSRTDPLVRQQTYAYNAAGNHTRAAARHPAGGRGGRADWL